MSLVFACVAAHTPLLMPTIGKEKLSQLEKTKKALEQLEQSLYLAQPETIIVITPHGAALPDALSINLNPKYATNFSEFGDLVTKLEWKADMMLMEGIRADFTDKHLPLALESSDALDYGSAVPLFYLTRHLPQVRIVPITTSGQDMKTHYNLGKELKDEIMSATKRIAVVASADLSHRAGKGSPEGHSERGEAFDEKITGLISNKTLNSVVDIDEAWIAEAKTCGAKVIAMLAGVLDEVGHTATLLSYEKPFGVGYAVAEMKVS